MKTILSLFYFQQPAYPFIRKSQYHVFLRKEFPLFMQVIRYVCIMGDSLHYRAIILMGILGEALVMCAMEIT